MVLRVGVRGQCPGRRATKIFEGHRWRAEGPERGAEEGRRNPVWLYAPRKIKKKSMLKSRIFPHFVS